MDQGWCIDVGFLLRFWHYIKYIIVRIGLKKPIFVFISNFVANPALNV